MQQSKTHMSRKQFRIGDLAKELKVKKFVVRFWEKEFDIRSNRPEDDQRFYTTEDLKIFMIIRDLLYAQGFTIADAKQQLPLIMNTVKTELKTDLVNLSDDEKTLQDFEDTDKNLIETATMFNDITEVNKQDLIENEISLNEESIQVSSYYQTDENNDQQVRPATIAPCNCNVVTEHLKGIKEKLLLLKEKVKNSQM